MPPGSPPRDQRAIGGLGLVVAAQALEELALVEAGEELRDRIAVDDRVGDRGLVVAGRGRGEGRQQRGRRVVRRPDVGAGEDGVGALALPVGHGLDAAIRPARWRIGGVDRRSAGRVAAAASHRRPAARR